jgi:hypothetical protein
MIKSFVMASLKGWKVFLNGKTGVMLIHVASGIMIGRGIDAVLDIREEHERRKIEEEARQRRIRIEEERREYEAQKTEHRNRELKKVIDDMKEVSKTESLAMRDTLSDWRRTLQDIIILES